MLREDWFSVSQLDKKIIRRKKKKTNEKDNTQIRERSVQFCPVGDTVKAMVDADTPDVSQERAAEETALLGLLCNLYSWIALRVVALQLLVHLCFNVSGEG